MSATHRFLMCPPKYYEVAYAINPWMACNAGGVCADKATRQWEKLYGLIRELGQVSLLEPLPGLPDMPFTANAGAVLRARVVVSRFLHPERRGEEAPYEDWFAGHGFEVYKTPPGVAFEGAGDALYDRDRDAIWMGWGFRSALAAHAHLSQHLDVEVLPLRLADERFYHLDTCFCPLRGGHLLFYPPAFDRRSLELIEARVPRDMLIAASEADAESFACNAVNIDDAVILNRASEGLRERLRAAGFSVAQADSSEFLKAGGAIKCLTLRLDESPPAQAAFRESLLTTGAFAGELAEGAL